MLRFSAVTTVVAAIKTKKKMASLFIMTVED
jgi:hypothetical protein